MNQRIFRKKNCLITGSTGGLGEELAIQFASSGCNVFLTGRNQKKLDKLKKYLVNKYKIKIFTKTADLTSTEDINLLIKTVRKNFSNVDILVNCAGIFPVKLMQDTTINEFDECFNINIRAPFLLSREFSTDMMKRKWGRIINIGSSSAYQGFRETSLYCASKHALLGFSRSIYEELREHNVRTFCISPGSVKTAMGKKVKNQNYETFMDPKEISEFILNIVKYDKEMNSWEIKIRRINAPN